ncbi:hypothetical protein RHGRI_029918 [Rhododendron griersonianum]|uniref:Protein kinase domain-containing protein n=1 Tax=Rhododendron griersonianum TaxID=479676 RepID=A0AAV6IRH7_9ERIC|nr:hypothetical protein RHGRI_029918 [Rhododendron griersonianum]
MVAPSSIRRAIHEFILTGPFCLFVDDFGWFSRVKVAIQFASLVEAFHFQNLKLRNICADNLVLDKDFHLKLVDFGMLIGGDFGDMPPFEHVWGCVGYVDPCFADTGFYLPMLSLCFI